MSHNNHADRISQRKHFAPHWSTESLNFALQKGDVFKSMFRVNAHNRVEAYCKIDGLPVDVLITGFHCQNRAIDGDIVVVKIEPLSSWTKMKGSIEASRVPVIEENNVNEILHGENVGQELIRPANSNYFNGNDHSSTSYSGEDRVLTLVEKLSTLINSFPSKRPTGRVVGIIEMSPRRKSIVGFLRIKQWFYNKEIVNKDAKKNKLLLTSPKRDYIQLISTDPKFPKMMVLVKTLPTNIIKRLEKCDSTLEMELVAAEIVEWSEDFDSPLAHVLHIFGRGGELAPLMSAILFQNSINTSDFPLEAISDFTHVPWIIPEKEFHHRSDLRNLCTFTIDPVTASDLDDALSVEKLPNDIYRVGVHIADVSYFVLPNTALDLEAESRSTSVYLPHYKLPMLPPLLSDNVGSLSPGVERLAFSIIWDINLDGEILDRWIGRTVIQSCCKLSYERAQDIIDGSLNVEGVQLHGHFTWSDVSTSVHNLNKISKVLKEKRLKDGALSLESPKIVFSYDKDGYPNDVFLSSGTKSNFLVEELMLLANTTAAEVITRAYPFSALLRRHPEPKLSKLKDLEAFCTKHGLQLDTSTSGQFHKSLECIRHELKDDSVFFHILMNYATKPMQLATYICSGDPLGDGDDWGHYALAVPLYTHFTSPLRRYADIVVHRTLAATLEAEKVLNINGKKLFKRCFTGLSFNKEEVESNDAQKALSDAAVKYAVPGTEELADIAQHCNERKLACRYVKEATDKLYMWLLLRNKQVFLSEARVLGLGPRFMSIYVTKLAIERRIYYDEVDGLTAEWLDVTSTLILSYCPTNRSHKNRSYNKLRTIEEVAMVTFSDNTVSERDISNDVNIEPKVFPLILNILSTIPVVIHPIGGDGGPIDIGARLYTSSYLC
ncbi:DIS3-like exonuclease 2 [Rutidosis leptorrhynchoides]|uniref:DIS3-like exonuclease 2 n=1 Tax=Rutidosis leptorrhynchoides TaxID=125765 RepID=UPI003A99EE29